MAWINKKLYWSWVEDRPKDKDGNYIGLVPPTPTIKKIDYVIIGKDNKRLVDGPNISDTNKFSLAIGVWDDDKYTPLNRGELETRLNTYVFASAPNKPFHGVIVGGQNG